MSFVSRKNFIFFCENLEYRELLSEKKNSYQIQNLSKNFGNFSIGVHFSIKHHGAMFLPCHSKIRKSTFHCNRFKVQTKIEYSNFGNFQNFQIGIETRLHTLHFNSRFQKQSFL